MVSTILPHSFHIETQQSGAADIQRRGQQSDAVAPEGQRTIPKFERHIAVAASSPSAVAVEGIERPMKAMAI
jgi:hypothetical protein